MAVAFNKIGFHLSGGGNAQGIGDWMRALDQANIPFFIKTADSMAGLFEAQELVKARRAAGLPDLHTLVFRRTGQGAGHGFDIPNYALEPAQAAADHWAMHLAAFPPELDPSITWVETTNELRKEAEWGHWLGQFALATAQITLAAGYRYAAFGFAAGTPEAAAWEKEGMLAFLELCASHPQRLAVALHEYSYTIADIWANRGELVGGFQKLFAACDRHGIARPAVMITEWGWEYNNVPEPDVAINHIEEAGALYGRYPEIIGAALWYLGAGYGGIANRAQRLIQPVTAFALTHRFEVEFDQPAAAEPDAIQPAPAGINDSQFLLDVSVPDDLHLAPGASFVKTWRVANSGTLPWGPGYRLVHVDGWPMTGVASQPAPATAPAQVAEISLPLTAPQQPGIYRGDWQLQDDAGNLFGHRLFLRIVVEPEVEAGFSDSRYLADETYPDGSEVTAGQPFTKTWRVQNSGNRAWGHGFSLAFIGGERMGAEVSFPLPPTAPGQSVFLSIFLKAPATPGLYRGDWQMRDDRGRLFGQPLFLIVRAVPPTVQPATPAGAPNNSRFVQDVTLPDGWRVPAGQEVVKVWRVQNNGTLPWGPGYELVHAGGPSLSAGLRWPIPPAAPGDNVELSLHLTAPATPGAYRTEWRLVDGQGHPFGHWLYAELNVVERVAESWPFEPERWRPTIWAITSIFESGRPEGDVAAFQNLDAGIVSYGKHQTTLSSGSLGKVVERFLALSSSPVAQALRQGFLARVQQRDRGLRSDVNFRQLLLAAALEPAMAQAQDAVMSERYYQPAVADLASLGWHSPLALAYLYDSRVQGGVTTVLSRVKSRLGGEQVGEAEALRLFGEERRAHLLGLAEGAAGRGQVNYARALRASVFRVAELGKLLEAGNLPLQGQFWIRQHLVQGIAYAA